MRKIGTIFLLVFAAIFAGCAKTQAPPPVQPVQAQMVDLKTQFRDLAEQLLSPLPQGALKGYVAMPAAFVNADNPAAVPQFGRYAAQELYGEFNQRGVAAREYNLDAFPNTNDAALAKRMKQRKCAAFLVGTYAPENNATVVKARLVGATNGQILSAGQITLPNDPQVTRLMAGAAAAGGAYVLSGSAPVLPPSYPSLVGAVIQTGTGYMPIVQGQ